MNEIPLQEIQPSQIEAKSMELITQELAQLGELPFSPEELPVVLRCIHTSADFDYAKNLRFTPEVVSIARKALTEGCTIVTDTNMAYSGINKKIASRFGCSLRCFMAEEDVAEEAKARGVTRALVSMERAAQLPGSVLVAIGNAPTALIQVCRQIEAGTFSPKVVIGAPVGFVNVIESKELLCQTQVPSITPLGRKGGSNIAAAICNALLYQASNNERE